MWRKLRERSRPRVASQPASEIPTIWFANESPAHEGTFLATARHERHPRRDCPRTWLRVRAHGYAAGQSILVSRAEIEQWITRAKRAIAEVGVEFDTPGASARRTRLAFIQEQNEEASRWFIRQAVRRVELLVDATDQHLWLERDRCVREYEGLSQLALGPRRACDAGGRSHDARGLPVQNALARRARQPVERILHDTRHAMVVLRRRHEEPDRLGHGLPEADHRGRNRGPFDVLAEARDVG